MSFGFLLWDFFLYKGIRTQMIVHSVRSVLEVWEPRNSLTFGEFSEFLANFRRIFRIFGEFLEFSAKKDKKIIGFENIEILDMGGSIRYTIRYTKKSDISAFDKFPIR